MKFPVESVAVVGPGLLGGSLALALSDGVDHLRLWGRRSVALDGALAVGFSGLGTTNFDEAVRGVDLVVLAVPVGVMPDMARQIAGLPACDRPKLVTDVGSVKGALARELPAILGPVGVEFVGAHPMCGSEQSGIDAARADLFDGARCFVCPSVGGSPPTVSVVSEFWRAVGCDVHRIDPDIHDDVVARISHMPHVMAAVVSLGALADDIEVGRFSGNGLRDTSRVASGGVAMWAEILLENRDAVAGVLERSVSTMEAFHTAVKNGDAATLTSLLSDAKALRDQLAGM